MSLQNFIPTLWSADILENLNKSLVYAGVANKDYQNEVKNEGDQIKINNIGRITAKTYVKGTPHDAPEALTSGQRILAIDQSDYIIFGINDIDEAQTKPKVRSEAMREAAYALRNKTDQYVAGLYTEFTNDLGAKTVDSTSAYDLLVDMANALDEADVPEFERWVIVPPAFYTLLRKDARFTDLSASGRDTLRSGEIGNVAGLTVLKSNNVPMVTTNYIIQAGYSGTITYADQIVQMEAFRSQTDFENVVRGLHVYGAKVVRPDTGVFATVTIS